MPFLSPGRATFVSSLCLFALIQPARSLTLQPELSPAQPHFVLAQVYPSDEQPLTAQNILTLLNWVRTDPAGYADWLETVRPYYNGAILSLPGETRLRTREGVNALEDAIAELRSRSPLPPLQLSSGMSQAAQDHVEDLGTVGAVGNQGSDGSHAGDRLRRYGNWRGQVVEQTSYGNRTPLAAVLLLVLSDGDLNRSQRSIIFNPNYQQIGIACGGHVTQETMCTLNYAVSYTANDNSLTAAATQAVFTPNRPEPQRQSTAIATEQTAATGATVTGATATGATVTGAIASAPYLESLRNTAYLSALERGIIAEVNRLRDNPRAYAAELENLKQYFDGNLLRFPGTVPLETVEGVAAVDEAIAVLRRTSRLPLLTPSQGMSLAARDHVLDLGAVGAVGHYGSDGSDPFERLERYGAWNLSPGRSIAGENISFSPINDARWQVLQWLIDDDVPNRGHRIALLRSDYQRTGVACGSHTVYGNMCVMGYASDYAERR